MRVLLITRHFPPVCCGVGDFASRLAAELTAEGNFVTVLTEPAGAARHASFEFRELPLGDRQDARAVLEAVAAAKPDRVLFEYSGSAWGRWSAPFWVNSLLFRLRRRGFAVHAGLHELAISIRQHPLHTPVALAQWLHVALILWAAESAAVNMRSRADLLARLFPWWRRKIQYRPNSSTIPVTPLAPADRGAFRSGHGAGPGEIIVATFGMFHRAKNYEGLIDAFGLLRRSTPAKLWMLGNTAAASPEYVARLKRAACAAGVEEHVWWPGKLEAEEVSRALQAADVFVLPQPDGHLTRSSAFMAAAEHGLPVVAVRQPGGRDQMEFTHGEHVWFAGRGTAEELAAGMLALAADPDLAARMGQSLRELYAARFAWSVTASMAMGDSAIHVPSGTESLTAQREGVARATHAGGAKS